MKIINKSVSVLASLMAAAMFVAPVTAGEWFVDASALTDGGDGLTVQTAKKYIQSAINLAEASEDEERVVTVLPGVYDSGVADVVTEGLPARVTISKPLTLRSQNGRAQTHIVGHYGTPADANEGKFDLENLGSGAVRGIYVASTAAGTVIEGFTIRGCATQYDKNNVWTSKCMGAGIYVPYKYKVYACDCVISDCYGLMASAMHYGTAVRCSFLRNSIGFSDAAIGSVGYTKIVNSVLARNKGRGGFAAGYNPVVLNCTLYGNIGPWGNGGTDNPTTFYNCLSVGNLYYGSYAGKELYSNNSVFSIAEGSDYLKIKGGDGNKYGAGGATKNFFASAVDDYRLMPRSAAVDAGSFDDYDRLTKELEIPERHRLLDWSGNSVVASAGGKIHCGAVQRVVDEDEVESGVLQLSADVGVSGFGRAENTNRWTVLGETVYQSLRSTNWPAQVCIDHFGRGAQILYFKDGNGYRYFGNVTNDECWVTLPPRGVTNCLSAQLASCVYYADAKRNDDSGDGQTLSTAKKTIQAAVEAARGVGDYALVLVAPGEYNEGGAVSDTSGKSRVLISGKSAMVRSMVGPERTVVCGEADNDTHGIGPKACRCVATECPGWFHGLTLTGGWTMNDSTKGMGAAFYGNGHSEIRGRALVDCIVTNNHARNCAAVYIGQADRTYFADNHNVVSGMESYSIFRNVLLTSCTVNREKDDLGIILREVSLHNCTIVGGDGSKSMSFDGKLKAYNTIFSGCGGLAALESGYAVSGCILYDTTIPASGAPSYGNINPVFADVSSGDVRPFTSSGIIGAGDSLSASDSLRWRLCGGDCMGRPMRFCGDKATPGSVQTFHNAAVCISNITASVSVTGNAREGWNSVAGDQKYVLTALDKVRPFRGFVVNGEYVVPRSYQIELNGTFAGKVVEPGYTKEWYVDAVKGSDSSDGMTPDTPKKTLAGAMTPAVISGDTVHAAAGDYQDGEMFYKGSTLASRVVVTNGVTLVADSGPSVTRIIGSPAVGREPGLGGLGIGAVRCVTLCEKSRLERFTIVNGHTLSSSQCGTSSADGQGGGVWFDKTSNDTVAYGCVITGNRAQAGGGVYKGYCCNCIFTDNLAESYGAMIDQGFAHGCSFDEIRCNASVINGYREVYGCTFGAGLLNADGSAKTTIGTANDSDETHSWCSKFANNVVMIAHVIGSNHVHVYNSVILAHDNIDRTRCVNCAFPESTGLFGLDSNLVPIPGSGSPALALADASKVSELCKDEDANGNPRVSNGATDSGAFQSDWRRRYAMDVKANWRRIPCIFASQQIHEEAESRRVRLEDGEIRFARNVEAEKAERLSIAAMFDDNATGKLFVYIDDDIVREYTGAGTHVADTVDLPGAIGTSVRFVYAKGENDEGSAELSLCQLPPSGLAIIVR